MKICLYAPFKPLAHPNPSGDLVIGRGIRDFLSERGHRVVAPSTLRCRWIYWKPGLLLRLLLERRRARRFVERFRPDLWLTYHTYYKAPDMLGPHVCDRKNIPYAIFQGIYSTKRRRDIRTGPGFLWNRRALRAACLVFANRREDEVNLKRIVPEDRLVYVAPGIFPEQFEFDARARARAREEWGVGDRPVVLSAAMFRPDVKTQGLALTIEACGKLRREGTDLFLAVAGDGKEGEKLRKLAENRLPGRVVFAGKIAREKMARFYSAGDVFAFPGIRESLGMVFLEAQSCGLPVVAFKNGGIPEVVEDGKTGFLTPFLSRKHYEDAISKLLEDPALAKRMGDRAARFVRGKHDLNVNYRTMESVLERTIRKAR